MDSWLSSTVAKYACAVAAGIGVIYYASRAYGFYFNSKSANESEEEKHNVVATNASVSDSDEIPQDDSMLVDNQVPAGYQEDRGASNGLSADPGDINLPELKPIGDVTLLLLDKFVYVSGGVDRKGCPLMIFPPSSDFSNINVTDIAKVFHYLVQRFRPEEQKKGFTVIVDRQTDKWESVELVLTRLQDLFPVAIKGVYVIKPQGYLQKYSESCLKSNLAYDFKVLILNDVPSLYEYVDKTQLTPSHGGTLRYEHPEWVQHRTAIDKFGETCCCIDSRLVALEQIFDKTDMSGLEIQETQHVLEDHKKMWFSVRDDLESAQNTGNTRLKFMKGDPEDTEYYICSPMLQSSVRDLQSLVDKLVDVKEKFQNVWEKHQTRVLQSLEFAFFEQECMQIRSLVMEARAKLSNMMELGNSLSAAMTLKKNVEAFEQETEIIIGRLVSLCERGGEMVRNNHHCAKSIKARCSDLENIKNELDRKVNRRKINLDKSAEIHECLQQISSWCQAGVDILATQPPNRFQSVEGAEKGLKEIDEFLKKPPGVDEEELNRMEEAIKELGDDDLLELMETALKRIGEVTEMIRKRETSFKKMLIKRPVQTVAPVPPPPPPAINKATVESSQKDEVDALLASFHPKQDDRSSKTSSPAPLRRPKSMSTPNISLEIPRSGSVDSPRTSNNVEVEVKRVKIMNELVETERDYVSDLQCVVEGYMKKYQEGSPDLPLELRGKKAIIFGNIDEIYQFHRDVFLRKLELCADHPLLLGEVFIDKEQEFQMYASYCKNKPNSEALWKEFGHFPFFQDCQRKLEHQLPLGAYLLKPIQRITRYQLFLKQMIKYSQKSQDFSERLEKALEGMMKVLENLNDVMHSASIRGFEGSLSNQGKLLMQDSFIIWQSSRKLGINMNLTNLKGKPRQVFLYEKIVVLTKRDDGANKHGVNYRFKNCLKMVDIGLTETVKEDPLKFGLWIQNKSEFYTFQATSQDVKKCWVQEIRKLLQYQFSQVKESRSLSINSVSSGSESELLLESSLLKPGMQNNVTKQFEDVVDGSREDDDHEDDESPTAYEWPLNEQTTTNVVEKP